MNHKTETTSTQAVNDLPTNTQTDNLARIANALERIADHQELLLSCREEQLDVLKELNHEFSMFSRHGFGL
jgi:hypothetical protein